MVLEEKGRTSVAHDAVVKYLSETDYCTILPITLEIIEAAKQVEGATELFDRLIAATAIHMEGKLITRDKLLAGLKNGQ